MAVLVQKAASSGRVLSSRPPPPGQTERFRISIIIITVFIKEPYTLEKVVLDCVCGAAER